MEEDLVCVLKSRGETISTMESCTGGLLCSNITNVVGSSDILKCSLVTYSNDFKLKFGVPLDVIEKYTVYSNETSEEMAKAVIRFTNSTWGIGITGRLGGIDKENPDSNNDVAYYTIFNRDSNICYNEKLVFNQNDRLEKKKIIVNNIVSHLCNILHLL